MTKEREELENQKEEEERRQKEFEVQIRSQMENYVKEHHDDRKMEEEQRLKINEFLEQPDTQSVFGLYHNSLYYLYKFYAS